MIDEQPKPKCPRRRWLRFSLRFLLVLLTLFAVAAGWFMNRVHKERRAISDLERLGGQISYEDEHRLKDDPMPEPTTFRKLVRLLWDANSADPCEVYFTERFVSDEALAILANLQRVHTLYLDGSSGADSALLQLEGHRGLRAVSARSANISDAGISHLSRLPNLVWLEINNNKITDAGLRHVAGCSQLECLHVAANRITDVGLRHLTRLNNLQELNISENQITDKGLHHLATLNKLRVLDLHATEVTNTGLAELGQFPALEVLNIAATNVSDRGLVHLDKLTRMLHVAQPGVRHLGRVFRGRLIF